MLLCEFVEFSMEWTNDHIFSVLFLGRGSEVSSCLIRQIVKQAHLLRITQLEDMNNQTKKINPRVAEQQQAQCPTDSPKLVYIFISASEMFSQSLQGACMKRYCDLVRVTRLLTIHFD